MFSTFTFSHLPDTFFFQSDMQLRNFVGVCVCVCVCLPDQNGLALIAIVGCVLAVLDAAALIAAVIFRMRKK